MKKTACTCLLLFIIIAIHAQTLRNTISLNGSWRFISDSTNAGQGKNWAAGLPAGAVTVQVPHTWNVMKGLEDYSGLAWYEKTFTVPASSRNKQFRLKFDAVYHDAVIYLNGTRLAAHTNAGYTTFYVDVTRQIKTGAPNKLVVSVSNAYAASNLPYKQKFDWCNDGGIIRGVHLQVTGKPSIRYVHITPDLNLADSTAKARLDLKLWEEDVAAIQAEVRIFEKHSKKNVFTKKLSLTKNGEAFTSAIDLGKVHLWHFNDPFLYQLQVTVQQQEQPTDQVTQTFGCRKIELRGQQFLLNNEAVRLPGLEYMPSSHPAYGSAEPRWVMDSVSNMFKDLNVTISRFHWQVDEYMLDQLDEKGVLLQAEIPWWQQPGRLTPELEEVARKQFVEMIERDYNHPCIFAWGISNEVYGDDRNPNQYRALKQFVKGLDSSRLVNVVSNETFRRKEKDESFIGDLPTWNEYIGTWFGKKTEELPAYFAGIESFLGDRPLLITENGLCEPRFAGGDLRRIEDMIYHYNEWAKRKYIAGCIYFCLNDYRTHIGEDGSANYKARIHGITDLYFNKKSSYHVFKQLASPILITNTKKLNETTVQVSLKNKDQLPCYTVRNFMITWPGRDGKRLSQQLPALKPGETATVTLTDMNARAGFDICTPAGYRVTSYPFVH
ncbi:glycoside hydrolase family 2 protein [Longitalea luteola]|uniref:glycoside hydrolase family 2 protein n=1 Tax=Longitalea luteola TaxID=2812563 RepID=UPI001A96A75B|nr:sugar-binding domain-containing protein [Longitalea luteola]